MLEYGIDKDHGKMVVGLMKDEHGSTIITKICAIRSKMYSVLTLDDK